MTSPDSVLAALCARRENRTGTALAGPLLHWRHAAPPGAEVRIFNRGPGSTGPEYSPLTPSMLRRQRTGDARFDEAVSMVVGAVDEPKTAVAEALRHACFGVVDRLGCPLLVSWNSTGLYLAAMPSSGRLFDPALARAVG